MHAYLFLSTISFLAAIAIVAPAGAQQQPESPAGEPPAAADAAPSAEAPASPWTVICPEDQAEGEAPADAGEAPDDRESACVMTQRLSATPDGPRLLQLYVRRIQADETPPADGSAAKPVDRLRIDLPFGLDLPTGLELRIDGEPWTNTPVRTCLAGGCVAFVPLSADDVTKLKRGGRLGVIVKAVDGRVIGWPVSLAGFTAAHAELEAKAQ